MNKLLWTPSQYKIKSSNMYEFMMLINKKYNKSLNSYNDLYNWSTENISNFWKEIFDYTQIKHSKTYTEVINNTTKMINSKWFSGARLNFAENLLKYKDDHLALIFRGENKIYKKLTYSELYKEVLKIAEAMKSKKIEANDRVAGFIPNIPESIIAMLATTSMGGIWSSCSPDFGIKGVLDRFGQIEPKILFSVDGYFYKGKKICILDKIANIAKKIPSIKTIVIIPYIESNPKITQIKNSILYEDFKSHSKKENIKFKQLPFSHPLYIMYSSGTTGLPKCMVQSAGGVLINHLKELTLHTNLKREDTIFYFTTCGWMMWNWLVSSLAVGSTIVLYDGNPFYPSADAMWKMVEDEKISIFGTSAGYLSALQNLEIKPKKIFDLSSLKTILSTGSPLSIENFEYVYKHIKSDVQLSSISGGTDLNGCFALGNPMLPVHAGELQCRGLGMKVKSFNKNAKSTIGKRGELVCVAPFPSMPIYFWNDKENEKYKKAYFNLYPNIWRHGDYIIITKNGGVIILGRSDTTLNPSGVRIGTAEIYRQTDQIEEIEDSIVVGQNWKNDVRIILFVKIYNEYILNKEIKNKIKKTIRANTSPRHIPSKIIQIPDIPYTINMKKVELAVQKTIHNENISNIDAIKNPEVLEFYKDIKELQED